MAHSLPEAARQAGDSQSRKARGNLGPRDGILHQTVSRPPVANQLFLGSWTVDIWQEGHSQRSASQRRHMAHLRQHSRCASRNSSSWDGGGDKTRCPPGESALAKLLGPGKGTKRRPNQVCAFVGYPEHPNLSSLDQRWARSPGPTLDSSPAEKLGTWAVQTGNAHTP